MNRAKQVWAFIASPIGLLLLGTLLASILIPRWSAIWQDRQPELELKTGLVDKVSTSTTETVRGSMSIAQERMRRKVAAQRYVALKKRWLISRAELHTVIGTYFSTEIARCWFLFSDRITDYVSIPQPGTSSGGNTQSLKNYIDDEKTSCTPLEDVAAYSQSRYEKLKQDVDDFSALASTKDPDFAKAYDSLGELLLIERDRIVRTIVTSDARGFAHGWWIFR